MGILIAFKVLQNGNQPETIEEKMEGFSFVTPITGLNTHNTGKEDDHEDQIKKHETGGACTGEVRDAHRILVRNLKRPSWRPRHKRHDNIKMDCNK
jgi:hypothetical protein